MRKFPLSIVCLLLIACLLAACDLPPEQPSAPTQTLPPQPESTAGTEQTLPSQPEEPTEPSETEPSYDPTKFDEENIVVSFGAISDIHIGENEEDGAKFLSAIQQLKAQADKLDADGLDAVVIAGDITHHGTTEEVEEFTRLVAEAGIGDKLLFTTGNHDYRGDYIDTHYFFDLMGEEYFQLDSSETNIPMGVRHASINGTHFLLLEPETYDRNVVYSWAPRKWLEKRLAAITAEDPNAYVFVFTHPMIYDTCYGSDQGSYWYTKHLTSILKKHPQVVAFGGHLHFPINDERSIHQGKFTSVGCGSVMSVDIEEGFLNAPGEVPDDAYEISSGHLVQVDINGNLRITRMNFSDGSTYKDPWELTAPKEDGSHLLSYTNDRAKHNAAPTLSGQIRWEMKADDPRVMVVSWPAGQDDDLVHHYRVDIRSADGKELLCPHYYCADFYQHSDPQQMQDVYTCELTPVLPGEYTITVTAVDSWGATSDPISCTVTVDYPIA